MPRTKKAVRNPLENVCTNQDRCFVRARTPDGCLVYAPIVEAADDAEGCKRMLQWALNGYLHNDDDSA